MFTKTNRITTISCREAKGSRMPSRKASSEPPPIQKP